MKWIKVDHKPPKFCDDILFTDGKKIYKGWLETYEAGEDLSFYNDASGIRANHWPEGVTHWIALLKLPKLEKE